MSRKTALRGTLAVIAVATAGVAALLFLRDRERRFRADVALARRDLDAGRVNAARGRLVTLAASRPADGEVAYLIGLAEEGRGRADAALAAWARVPPGSPFATQAAIHGARVLVDVGHLARAEALLEPIPRGRGDDAVGLRQTLELIYRLQGRSAEVRDLIVESWAKSPDPARVLWRIYMLDHSAFPGELVERVTAHAEPDDDRVQLAKANLATLSGRYDEARTLIESSLARRPGDPAAWRLELARSVAAADPVALLRAAAQLPARRFGEPERLRLRAALARIGRDAPAERAALEALVAQTPEELPATDRLAELALGRGDRDEARRLRLRATAFHDLRERYDALIDRDDRASAAPELARLAAELGRRVEARGWSLIRDGLAAREPLVPRLDTDAAPADRRRGPTLADQLADLAPPGGPPARPGPDDAPGPIRFVDDAAAAGLRFIYDNGHLAGRASRLPETMGGGVGLLDFDRDGWLDVFAVQGGPFPPARGPGDDGDHLYRNAHDGTFEDVTRRSGIGSFAGGYGHGVAVGDFDNDGRPDLFVTRWRSYALYRNQGDGTFEDVTAASGLGGDRDWPTSAAFADLDNDGDLDLYVCHYLDYDETKPVHCEHPQSNAEHLCSPIDFKARPDHAFRNDGGTFVDVTEAAGLAESKGRGLGVVAADLDGDGLIDLYVANDMSANYLYRNLGGFRFAEVGIDSGTALSAEGNSKAGMGLACGDTDGDGRLDLAVTNFYGESATFYRNLGEGMFADESAGSGLAASTRLRLGFGTTFLDANNDGRLDLLIANGHINDGRPRFPWMMPIQLLAGGPGGRFSDVSGLSGAPFGPLHLGRGFGAGDLDNDGQVDAVVCCQNEPLVYLHNRTVPGNSSHFIAFEVEGTTSNRDGVGAIVTVHAGPRRWTIPRLGGGNYQSACGPGLHLGLGTSARVDRVEVAWPSGRLDRHGPLDAGRRYRLREGDASIHPLAGQGSPDRWNRSTASMRISSMNPATCSAGGCPSGVITSRKKSASWPVSVAPTGMPTIRGSTRHDPPARPPSPGSASSRPPGRPGSAESSPASRSCPRTSSGRSPPRGDASPC